QVSGTTCQFDKLQPEPMRMSEVSEVFGLRKGKTMKRKPKTDEPHAKKPKPATTPPRSKYQIFPPHPPGRHEALKASIIHHGIETSTTWDEVGNLLDGWERESISSELAITCPREVRHFGSEGEKFQFILAVNAHRRPALNQKQKREVIAAYLQGDPEVADNTL